MIIFSCVRTAGSGGIGFLNDLRRLNVALTRAQCSLWLVGNPSSLVQSPVWRSLLNDARDRGALVPWRSEAEWFRRLRITGGGNAGPPTNLVNRPAVTKMSHLGETMVKTPTAILPPSSNKRVVDPPSFAAVEQPPSKSE